MRFAQYPPGCSANFDYEAAWTRLGAGGVCHQELDGMDGRVLGDREPWKGTTADIFVHARFQEVRVC